MKNVYYCDIEVFPNFFYVAAKNIKTGEVKEFEISERKNQLEEYCKWYENTDVLITFNGIHYDCPVMNFVYKNKFIEGGKGFNRLIKQFSDFIIQNNLWWKDKKLKKYKYDQPWIDVDLFLYWSKDLRINKRISLKSLGIQLGYPVVQELPYPHDKILTEEEMDNVVHYCKVHDIGITEMLFNEKVIWQGKPTTFKDMLKLRIDIDRKYNLKAYSWDSPKIASEILLKEYCNHTKERYWDVKNRVNHWKKKLPLQNPEFQTPEFQEVFDEMSKVTTDYSKTVHFIKNNTRITLDFGKGGLHSRNDCEIYESSDEQLVVTSDFASLYPNLAINYGLFVDPILAKIYRKILNERLDAKAKKKLDPYYAALDAYLKLVLNSYSGLMDNQYSWLYYPEGAMKMRLMGQLILTKCIEVLSLEGYQVISANTDGIEYICSGNNTKEKAEKLLSAVETQFNLVLEHEVYQKIVYKNVNNYIAISDKGSVKKKGIIFVTDPNIGDSCNSLVIPRALEYYFTGKGSVEDYIKSPDRHIFDFCISKKVDKSYTVQYGEEDLFQRLNKYYVCRTGRYLYKKRVKGGVLQQSHLLKGWGVCLHNVHEEMDINQYDINYNYYISEANKIINEIETASRKQISLF